MVRALLIEFDLNTGKRAGSIDPRDPKLPCHGWQDLESTPACEVRLVEDDRDLTPYQGIPGITILEGKDEINAAIERIVPEQYQCQSDALMMEHLRQKGIHLDVYAGWKQGDILKDLYSKRVAGIFKRPVAKVD